MRKHFVDTDIRNQIKAHYQAWSQRMSTSAGLTALYGYMG